MKTVIGLIVCLFCMSAFALDRPLETSQRMMRTFSVNLIDGTETYTETIRTEGYDTTDAKVATTTDSFESVAAHPFVLCDRVRLTGTGTPTIPTGLSADLDYFVIVNSATSLSLATTCALATAGTKVDITAVGAGTIFVSGIEFKTSVPHTFITGDRVTISTGGTLPAGLSAGAYWVIVDSANKFRLASVLTNAQTGTAVEWTDAIGETPGTDIIAIETKKLSGPDRNRMTMQTQSVGVYKLTFNDNNPGIFYSADQIIALASASEVDANANVTTIHKDYVIVTTEVATTGANTDKSFSLLVIGSKIGDNY